MVSKSSSKIDNSTQYTVYATLTIFDEHITFCDRISTLSKKCYSYSHIRKFRPLYLYLSLLYLEVDSKTASTIAASIIHSKLDYCNSPYYNIPSFVLGFEQTRNFARRRKIRE